MKQFLSTEGYALEVQTNEAFRNGFTVGLVIVKGKPIKTNWYKTKSGFTTIQPKSSENGSDGMNLGNLPTTLSLPTTDDESDPWSDIF
jgi:hypothetical protein